MLDPLKTLLPNSEYQNGCPIQCETYVDMKQKVNSYQTCSAHRMLHQPNSEDYSPTTTKQILIPTNSTKMSHQRIQGPTLRGETIFFVSSIFVIKNNIAKEFVKSNDARCHVVDKI